MSASQQTFDFMECLAKLRDAASALGDTVAEKWAGEHLSGYVIRYAAAKRGEKLSAPAPAPAPPSKPVTAVHRRAKEFISKCLIHKPGDRLYVADLKLLYKCWKGEPLSDYMVDFIGQEYGGFKKNASGLRYLEDVGNLSQAKPPQV